MRLRYPFTFRHIADTWLGSAIDVSSAENGAEAFNGILQLNDTGYFIVHCIEQGAQTPQELTEALCCEYDIDQPTAHAAVQHIIDYLIKEGVLI